MLNQLATTALLVLTAILASAADKPSGHRVRASSQVSEKNVYRIVVNPPLFVRTKSCLEIVVDQDVIFDRARRFVGRRHCQTACIRGTTVVTLSHNSSLMAKNLAERSEN
jgi:hypothetical protein